MTRTRVRAYCTLLLLGYGAIIIMLWATADGIVDVAGRPLGTDFANIYAAGKLAREGHPALAYDWAAHHAMQREIAGRSDIPFFPWSYPPLFLMVAAGLATLPYLAALLLYQTVTMLPYLAVVRRIVQRPDSVLLALAFPGVFVNLTHGHNGFISAALLGGGLAVLDRQPVLAGVLLGGMAYKPQFALLIPVVLAATGRWRTFAAAAATVLLAAGLACIAFGSDTFLAFWRALPLAQRVILEGGPGFHKVQSIYAALRLAGVPMGPASAVQILAALGLAITLAVLWRSAADFELKAAALALGSVLSTPYALDYDLVMLAPAMAFLAGHGLRKGFAPYEITLLAALWIMPLIVRPIAEATHVSLAPVAMLAALLLILRRADIIPTPLSVAVRRIAPR